MAIIKNPLTIIKSTTPVEPSTGQYLVQVIDYDGTILKSENLNTNDTFTLPSSPTHTGLTFQSWSSPVTITSNTITVGNSDITIGATYMTSSGLSEFDITLTTVTGLVITFQNLTGMTSIDWGDGNTDSTLTHTYSTIGNYTIKITGLTSLGEYIFTQSSSIKNYYCTNIRLSNSVTSIGDYAFSNCYSITSITIPNSVTSIGDYAFYNCRSLTSIIIPDSVTSIGASAFYNCSSITSITIPNSVTSIGASVFSGCVSLTSITIPNSVTSIGASAISNCYSITSITIPNSVTSIGKMAFSGCYSLTSITIPNSVTSIGDYAFYYCRSLTSITIPNSVTSIGASAFSNCYSIIEYNFSSATSIPALSNINAFTEINGICTIKVPSSLYDSWIVATNWSTYADYIKAV